MKGNHLCSECIWFDQCRRKNICEHFDNGQNYPSEEEIEKTIQRAKIQYQSEFYKYLKEWNDGF